MSGSILGLWRDTDYLKFWSAQSLSLVGAQFGQLALPLVAILALDASAGEVGLLLALAPTPWLVLGLWLGGLIDRLPRRVVLMCAQIGRASLLATVPVTALTGDLTMTHLYIVMLGVGTLDVCFQIAYRSYLPSLVHRDQLHEGNARIAAADGVTRTAGPSIAGITIQLLTAPIALAVQSLSYVSAALLLSRIRHREKPTADTTSSVLTWSSLTAGIRYAWRQILVRTLTLSDATYMFCFSIVSAVLLVFFTRNVGLSPTLIGLTYTVGSLGGVLAAVLAGRIGRRLKPGRTIIGASLLRGAGIALMPLAAFAGVLAIPLVITARLINAFGWTLWEVHQETTQQGIIPDRLRGRVNASTLFAVRGIDALGTYAGAALAVLLGVVPTLAIGAVGALAGSLWLFTTALWRLDAYPAPDTPGPAENA